MPFAVLQTLPNEAFASMGISPNIAEKIKLKEEISDVIFTKLLEATSRTPLEETGAYVGLPGTSMATPIVSGIAAAMIGANPDLTPDLVADILKGTAEKLSDKRLGPNTQGAGAVNAEQAILKSLTTKVDKPEPKLISGDDLKAELAKLGVSLEDLLGGGAEKPGAPAEGGEKPADPQPAPSREEAPKAEKTSRKHKSKKS
jgi:subtilisin family serine protease